MKDADRFLLCFNAKYLFFMLTGDIKRMTVLQTDRQNGPLKETECIRNAIANAIEDGYREFIIFPFGDMGRMCKEILNDGFHIREKYLIDSFYSKYSKEILSIDQLDAIDVSGVAMLFTLEDIEVENSEVLLTEVKKHFPKKQIYDCFPNNHKRWTTVCGKYSYGPLCNHWLVEKVGAFCSFALGTDAVENHATDYISTSPFLYVEPKFNPAFVTGDSYEDYKYCKWYFEGVHPHGIVRKLKRISIGNDVWLGRNVLITNGASIGNGVIAGAGAIITKDIPDYAVVVGAPARIIRYRYSPEQISALNQIAWWNWSDRKIREYYEDFYYDADTFIKKHIHDIDEKNTGR